MIVYQVAASDTPKVTARRSYSKSARMSARAASTCVRRRRGRAGQGDPVVVATRGHDEDGYAGPEGNATGGDGEKKTSVAEARLLLRR